MNRPCGQRLLDRAPRFHAAAVGRGQRGAVLVIGLIILLLVSLISVTGANRTLLDEHMASNQYTQTNSFLAAEAGITVAQHIAGDSDIKKAVEGGDAKAIESAWESKISQYESWNTMGGSQNGAAAFRLSKLDGHSTYWDPDTQTLDVASHGRLTSGTSTLAGRTLGAQIIPAQNTSSGPPTFTGGLIVGTGISLGSAATSIDTYNSNYGAYGQSVTANDQSFLNSNSKNTTDQLSGVSVQTCSSDSNISLSGNAPIYGDVLGVGNLTSNGQPKVYGNVHVNGTADFHGDVYGNFTVGGNATLGKAYIAGNVRVGGSLTTGSNSTIDGTVTEGATIQPVSQSDTGCASLTGNKPSAALTAMFSAVRQMNPSPINLSSANVIGTAGESTYRHVSSNVSVDHPLTIHGHVTLLVDGNFTLDKKGVIDIGSTDDLTATLTLLVTGTTELGGTTTIAPGSPFVRPGPNGQLQPAIAVYTTFDSSGSSTVGVTIPAKGDVHVAVYAPKATVNIGGNGDLYGSVVAKVINQSGGGSIHYDEALKKVTIGSGSNSASTKAQVKSWWQITGA